MKNILFIIISFSFCNAYSQSTMIFETNHNKNNYFGVIAKMPNDSQILNTTNSQLLKKKNVIVKTPSQSQITETPKNAIKSENNYAKPALEIKVEDL